MARFTINGISHDPLADSAQSSSLTGDGSRSNYVLIQAAGPLNPEDRAQLERAGVVIHEYVGGDTYLCGFRGTDLGAIGAIPSVVWADVYSPGFKVAPSLRGDGEDPGSLPRRSSSDSRESREVDVVLHADIDPGSADLKTRVAAAARIDESRIQLGRHKYRLVTEGRHLDDIAAIDEVRQIEEVIEAGLSNNVAGPIIGSTVVVNGTPYQGDGQVIAVADTGFDMGSKTNVHPAFTGRVAKLYDLGRPNKTDDPNGHGTHVAGSALGDGNSASMGGAIQGTAPKARLVLQSMLDASDGLGGIPADLHDLFSPPYDNDGARVHTNSWNTLSPGVAYNTRATEIDDFVWSHQDMVILFCAGNYGTDGDSNGVVEDSQIGAEAGAKNAITVGASESNRGSATWTWGTYVDAVRPGVMFKANPIKG
ncbi:MAG: S8 family serine peptidase, partial [Actinomycetota bacterium]|nr:S8 family serine peptidase [Actinomycetota bacterium]